MFARCSAGNNLVEAVLEQAPEGIVIADADDVVVFTNKVAEEVKSIAADEVLGCSLISCHPESAREGVEDVLKFLRNNGRKALRGISFDVGRERYSEDTYRGVFDNANNYIGSVMISRDVTDSRRREDERVSQMQNLREKVDELTAELQNLFICSMSSLVTALEAKDYYTKGHSLRVCDIAVKMVERGRGISRELKEIELAGKLHDIGKIGIREAILNKPGMLTKDEFGHIKEHPIIGENILASIEKLKSVASVIRHHHERFDGGGYPDNLEGESIPEGAKILAIADSYDAMTSARPYRPTIAAQKAAGEIESNAGKQFDPRWTGIFLDLFHSGAVA